MDGEQVHAAIQQHVAPEQGVMLTKWMLVAEWMDGDGRKLLTRAASDGCALWDIRGLAHEALNGGWGDDGGLAA